MQTATLTLRFATEMLRRSCRPLLHCRAFASSATRVMNAQKIALDEVPLVDIAPLVQLQRSGGAPSDAHKAQILTDMRRACVDTGFFSVPTKDVLSNDLIAKVRCPLLVCSDAAVLALERYNNIHTRTQVYKRADEFIALPHDVKLQYHNKTTPNSRGWTPMFEEPSVGAGCDGGGVVQGRGMTSSVCLAWCGFQYQPDVVSHLEGFDLARELPTSFVQAGSSLGPNVWPAELPHFQQDVYQLYEETTAVSDVLFQSFAEMLGLPADTFAVRKRRCRLAPSLLPHPFCRSVVCVLSSSLLPPQRHVTEKAEAFMRLLTYPEVAAAVKNSTVGIASHTDFECFTIIHQNGAGLHLKNRSGHWVEAPVHEDRCACAHWIVGAEDSVSWCVTSTRRGVDGTGCSSWWATCSSSGRTGFSKPPRYRASAILFSGYRVDLSVKALTPTCCYSHDAVCQHRVVNSEKKRQSIVRFNGADGETVVEPLAAFVSAAHPAKYERTTQREHIAEQIRLAEERLQETKAAKKAAA